jgi:hypothetical protein
MKKHGLSHSIGTFITVIASAALSKTIENHLPCLYNFIFTLSTILRNLIPFVSEKVIGYALIASFLMFLWGIGFYFAHKD